MRFGAAPVVLLLACSGNPDAGGHAGTDASVDSATEGAAGSGGTPAASCPACAPATLTCTNGPDTESITAELIQTPGGCEARWTSTGEVVFSLVCTPLQMCSSSCHDAVFAGGTLTWSDGGEAACYAPKG